MFRYSVLSLRLSHKCLISIWASFLRVLGGVTQDYGGERSYIFHSDKYLPHATWPGIMEPPSFYAGKVKAPH